VKEGGGRKRKGEGEGGKWISLPLGERGGGWKQSREKENHREKRESFSSILREKGSASSH